jgi:predicted  nucleic acid-binding Zn ribbon protein
MQKDPSINNIIRENIFNELKMKQAERILEDLSFDEMYEGKYKGRDITYSFSEKNEEMSILDKHDEYIFKRQNNGSINLEVNGRKEEKLDKDQVKLLDETFNNLKCLEASKAVSSNKEKTMSFIGKFFPFDSSTNSKGEDVIKGQTQSSKKVLTKTIYDFFQENNYIKKLKNSNSNNNKINI